MPTLISDLCFPLTNQETKLTTGQLYASHAAGKTKHLRCHSGCGMYWYMSSATCSRVPLCKHLCSESTKEREEELAEGEGKVLVEEVA